MLPNEPRDDVEELVRQGCDVPPPSESFVKGLRGRLEEELRRSRQDTSGRGVPPDPRAAPTGRRTRRRILVGLAIAGVSEMNPRITSPNRNALSGFVS